MLPKQWASFFGKFVAEIFQKVAQSVKYKIKSTIFMML